MMFGYFRKKRAPGGSSADGITTKVLADMGFELTPYGKGIVVASRRRGCSPHETACLVAYMTIARDIKEAGGDVLELVEISSRASLVIKMLGRFKEQGLMRDHLYADGVTAIKNTAYFKAQSEKWVEIILGSDPTAGKERLATNARRSTAHLLER